jgi:hypothetical protein
MQSTLLKKRTSNNNHVIPKEIESISHSQRRRSLKALRASGVACQDGIVKIMLSP